MAVRLRNDPVRILWRRLLIFGLLVLVGIGVGGVWNAYEKASESKALRAQAQMQLEDLVERQTKLNSGIADLETDRGREEVLREQYALAAKGEGLIIIVDTPPLVPTEETSSLLEWLKKTFTWW